MPSTAIPANQAPSPLPRESRRPVQCQKAERWPEHDTLRPLGMLLGPPASWCAWKSTQDRDRKSMSDSLHIWIQRQQVVYCSLKSYRVQSIIPLYVSSPSPFCKVCRRVFMTGHAFKTQNDSHYIHSQMTEQTVARSENHSMLIAT